VPYGFASNNSLYNDGQCTNYLNPPPIGLNTLTVLEQADGINNTSFQLYWLQAKWLC
jgi:hypothetical protein